MSEMEAGLSPSVELLCRAIAQKLCVEVVYNKTAMKLAPHILYTRHDDHFVDAVTVEQDGRKPKVTKLGTFKVAGLTGVALTKRLFAAQRLFDPSDPKYAGTTTCVINGV